MRVDEIYNKPCKKSLLTKVMHKMQKITILVMQLEQQMISEQKCRGRFVGSPLTPKANQCWNRIVVGLELAWVQ